MKNRRKTGRIRNSKGVATLCINHHGMQAGSTKIRKRRERDQYKIQPVKNGSRRHRTGDTRCHLSFTLQFPNGRHIHQQLNCPTVCHLVRKNCTTTAEEGRSSRKVSPGLPAALEKIPEMLYTERHHRRVGFQVNRVEVYLQRTLSFAAHYPQPTSASF